MLQMLVPVALKSKANVCSHSPAETVSSNPARGMDVCLLWVLCDVRQWPLQWADHSSEGVLLTVVCCCVW